MASIDNHSTVPWSVSTGQLSERRSQRQPAPPPSDAMPYARAGLWLGGLLGAAEAGILTALVMTAPASAWAIWWWISVAAVTGGFAGALFGGLLGAAAGWMFADEVPAWAVPCARRASADRRFGRRVGGRDSVG